MANSRGRYFDNAPPPPPPGSESYRNSKHGETNPAYSQYSSKPYQASAYIQPRSSVNPPVPGQASNGTMNYPNAPPLPPQYSAYPAYLPPPPPPLPPKYAPHSAPPPPPPPEPYPSSTQHGFQNQFKQQSGFGHRPQFRPQQNARPRFQAQFSERGSRPRSQFHPQESRQRYPDSKEFSPRFRPFTGMRFQRPQHPREFRPAGHRQPSNNYRNEGPSRYPVRNQNGAPLLRLHTERFGHNPVRAGGSDDRVARNPPGVSNGSECRVARNPGTSRFSDEVKFTAGSLLPPWTSGSESETPDVKIDLNSQPLQPPPMPPMFTWSESEIKPPESITELKLSEPGLPFLPVPMEKIDLVQMAQVLEKQQAEDNGATIRNLVKDGSILAQWPQELKELFQPLYCKLCVLTLSSAIVAMDHYKGKKHHKKADMWLAERRQGNRVQTTIPHFVRSSDLVLNRVPQISVAAPISGSNCTPLGFGFSPIGGSVRPAGRKRNASEGVYNPSGVSKTFPLGRPPKNPKKEPLNSRSFDYCHPCKVALTSQSHADQHYTGKPHAKKVATVRKEGHFGDDSRFGIGKSFIKTDTFSTLGQPSSTENARPMTPLAMEDFPTEHPCPTVVENFTPLAQHLPAAEVFSAQQIPAAEVLSAQQIPAAEVLFAQQIPAVENNVTLF